MRSFDALETRDPAEREAARLEALRDVVRDAKANAPHYQRTLAEVDPDSLTSREALAALPVLYKSDLPELQAAMPPLGGLATRPVSAFRRLYLSPGPIAEPEGETPHWRMGRALHAAGIGAGDVVLNAFAYHLTPAGAMFDAGAAEVGATTVPAGVGNSDTQADAIGHLGVTAYVGTPDYLKVLLEKADARGVDASRLTKALVSGGPLFPELREGYEARGIAVRQCYGTAELGLIAYETVPGEGLVMDEAALVEVVRPGTGDPLPDGEVGEVVVTTFNPDYPLIRLATGDLSAVLTGPSPCGRTGRRLRGWMGRADQTTKVRGMFVHPRQVARVLAAFPEVRRARLEVGGSGGQDTLTLHVEGTGEPGLAERLAEAVRAECRVRGEVRFVPEGSLPNDGKVIEDVRPPTG